MDTTAGMVIQLERKRLRKAIAETLKDLDIEPADIDKYLNCTALRDDLIRREYNQKRYEGMKAEYLNCVLGEKYGLSYKTIWDIVHHPKRKDKKDE